MDTFIKARKLRAELVAARATDGDLDDAITAAEATAFADITDTPTQLKQFYYQATAPSHATVACVASTVRAGDYWIDSDDNKLYLSDGSTWAEIQDNDIGAAQSLIDDIAADDKITAVEKLTIKPVWDAIVTEGTLTTGTLVIQAAAFSVDDSDFDSAYAALYAYIITSLDVFASMSATTTVVRSTWDGHWNLYYDERTNLINDIETAAKALADTAQGLIDDIADDAKITAVEKLTLKPIWDAIVTEATLTTGTLVVQAAAFSVADADFDAAYAALYAYIITSLDVFNDMSATTSITRATWDGHWNLYWDERTNLLNDIATAAKDLADAADTAADAAQADATDAKTKTDLGFDASGNLITKVIPDSAAAPSGSGFYLGSDYLGYYASGTWKTFVDNTGNFYLGGTSGALQWNGSSLSLVGNINITDTSTIGQLLQVTSGGSIRSNTTGNYPYLELSNSGLQLKTSDTGGTVGTAVVGTDEVGAGALIWIMNSSYNIPWMEMKEPQDDSGNDMPSLRFYERGFDPTGGTYQDGDLCNVSGFIKCYYSGGWKTSLMTISTESVSSGAGSVKMASANPADNAGWIEVDVNKFVPYWTDATP